MLDAGYTFRFSGYAMREGATPHFIVGVGLLTFRPDGTLAGSQHSSITALTGPDASQAHSIYTLTGRYALEAGLSASAQIAFKAAAAQPGGGPPPQDMHGEFRLVGVGDYDRLWLISTRGVIPAFGLPVDEVISGEAVRIQDGAPPPSVKAASSPRGRARRAAPA